VLERRFPHRFVNGEPDSDLPFFPDRFGKPFAKKEFIHMVFEAARRLGLPTSSPDGARTLSGHSMRVSGAQGLAMLGVDTFSVQLLGRWGSTAVQGYMGEASISMTATQVRSARVGSTLAGFTDGLLEQARAEQRLARPVLHLPPVLDREPPEDPQPDHVDHRSGHHVAQEQAEQQEREEGPKQPPSPTSSSSSSSSSASPGEPEPDAVHEDIGSINPDTLVCNIKTRTLHKILVGPPVDDPSLWITVCGWRFGKTRNKTAGQPELAQAKCGHCWREGVVS